MEGNATRNAIFILRMFCKRSIEMQKDMYLCFIDYEKAFDRVKHDDLIEISKGTGMDGKKFKDVIQTLLESESGCKMGTARSDWLNIRRGVRQGCVFSPIEGKKGFAIGGRNIRYADDTVLIADSQKKLQDTVTTVKEASEE